MSKQNRVRATATRVYVNPATHPCVHCKVLIGARHLCYGCGKIICDGCDETGVEGPHDASDHKRRKA